MPFFARRRLNRGLRQRPDSLGSTDTRQQQGQAGVDRRQLRHHLGLVGTTCYPRSGPRHHTNCGSLDQSATTADIRRSGPRQAPVAAEGVVVDVWTVEGRRLATHLSPPTAGSGVVALGELSRWFTGADDGPGHRPWAVISRPRNAGNQGIARSVNAGRKLTPFRRASSRPGRNTPAR